MQKKTHIREKKRCFSCKRHLDVLSLHTETGQTTYEILSKYTFSTRSVRAVYAQLTRSIRGATHFCVTSAYDKRNLSVR